MLDLTGDVFGVEYRKVEMPIWHPDVLTYAIHDRESGELISHFHMDLYPREGKFSHAAAFPLVSGRRLPDGSYQKPLSAIVANFTKPGSDRPSLLQHSEVETFFHEFGHILHQTLTKAETTRFAGSSTENDFVEAPSQIMENWTWRPEILRRFARHYQTGETIPDRSGRSTGGGQEPEHRLAHLAAGELRLARHVAARRGSRRRTSTRFCRRATDVSLFPPHEGTFFPASFGHLLSGYDAGYYGYLWSEVYGDDMWSRFDDEGVDNPEVGREYRRAILEKGGSVDGMDMLRDFLGREPNNQAFLKRLGIGTKPAS